MSCMDMLPEEWFVNHRVQMEPRARAEELRIIEGMKNSKLQGVGEDVNRDA